MGGSITCLAVPGYPTGARTWEILASELPLSLGMRVIELPDHVGATLGDQRDALLATIEATRPTVILGHSLGAYLVGSVLSHLGERVALTVMIGGFASLSPEIVARIEAVVSLLEQGVLEGEARRQLVHDQLIAPDHLQGSAAECVESMFVGIPALDLTRMLRRGLDPSAKPVVRHRARSLVVHGTADRAVPLADGQHLASLGSKSRFVPIAGAGHFPHVVHAARVAREIAELLG
jgi:pimeloyl-ACP methyl ester carboxylesterase